MAMQMHGRMMRPNREELKDKKLERALMRRVWGYARPYRARLILFLLAVAISAMVMLVPPLLFRQVVDNAIPDKDRGLAITLALLAAGVAIFGTVLDLAERWFSSQIGEGVIFDLRTSLYDHVH